MSRFILTIDSSTETGSVCLSKEGLPVGEILLRTGMHSDHLLTSINQLFEVQQIEVTDLAAIAAIVGPGSFTGLRVGVATAKGLALAANKPLIAISSLQVMAQQVSPSPWPICALLDARKHEVYNCMYKQGEIYPEALTPEQVTEPDKLLAKIDKPTLFIGSGALAYQEKIEHSLGDLALFPAPQLHILRAGSATCLAEKLFDSGCCVTNENFVPVYIRPSDAEIAQRKA